MSALSCAWAYERMQGRTPPSWGVARRLMENGAAGMLVPSIANGATAEMTNLVPWRWGDALPHLVRVFDPGGRLPKDQSSWE